MQPDCSSNKNTPVVWSIAASDSGGGAGIQADLKTFTDLNCHGCTAITALTAQNSTEVSNIEITPSAFLDEQIVTLYDDMPPQAIKIGMVGSLENIHSIKNFLEDKTVFTVCDPVLSASTGKSFAKQNIIEGYKTLLPYVSLFTPNIHEATALTETSINSCEEMVNAANQLLNMGAQAVLLKGGHSQGDYCQDYFTDGTHCFWLTNQTQDTPHTHGTGCTLSSAIAAFLAQGKSLSDALVLGNAYVQQGIRLASTPGKGNGCVTQQSWPTTFTDYPQISTNPEHINLPEFASCETFQLGLYPVVDTVEWLEKLLPLGVNTIQLRIKNKPLEEIDQQIAQAVALGEQYQARLFVNDYWELAIKHGAYGVHLGQEDLDTANLKAIQQAGVRLGISTHSEYEWARATTVKPSYIACGTVYPTQTKPAILIGTANLQRWVKTLQSHFPVTAIGGIKHHNIQPVLDSHVGSIAVVTAITEADDYKQETQRWLNYFNNTAQ